jgi:hypothetical protein
MAINEVNNNVSIGDKFGSIFMIDIESQRFEQTLKFDSCVTCIAFVNECEQINLIVATTHENTIYRLSKRSKVNKTFFLFSDTLENF